MLPAIAPPMLPPDHRLDPLLEPTVPPQIERDLVPCSHGPLIGLRTSGPRTPGPRTQGPRIPGPRAAGPRITGLVVTIPRLTAPVIANLIAVALGLALTLVILFATHAAKAQSLSLNLAPGGAAGAPGGSQSLASNLVGLVAITTLLTIAPGILVMGTAFTRLVVVLSMLRTALGLQQTPPNTVIISLALFLTAFIMAPAFETAYRDAVQPLRDGSITEEQAFDRGVKPFRGFMEANVSDKDLALFIDLAGWKPSAGSTSDTQAGSATGAATDAPTAVPGAHGGSGPGSISRAVRADLPLTVLCPAFLISELSKAFQIGFLLFLPFLVIDIAVSAILMGMGMMMLPPVVVSLPFKLIFFVLVNGWELVAGSMVRSFSG